MYWHIDTDLVSLIVMAALYVYYDKIFHPSADDLQGRRFSRCLAAGVCVTIIDIAASIVMEISASRFFFHLLMTLYMASIELVIVEWFLYVSTILYEKDSKHRKRVVAVVWGFYGIYALLAVTNPWTGMLYSLGPNNEYTRGPLFLLMVGVYGVLVLALFVLILCRWKQIPSKYPSGILLLTPLIICVGIVTQLLVPGWLLILPSYMICLVLAFLFLQNMRTKTDREQLLTLSKAAETDPLTGLLNRSGMNLMVEQTLARDAGQTVLVLLADIDDLKGLNDTLGHAEGDRAIKAVAAQLRNHFRSYDTLVRYGGDEFLVFLTGALNDMQMQRSLQQLVADISGVFIGGDNDVPVHVSIGAASGIVGADAFQTLCQRADAALYHVKRTGKNSFAFYRPEMEREFLVRKSASAVR